MMCTKMIEIWFEQIDKWKSLQDLSTFNKDSVYAAMPNGAKKMEASLLLPVTASPLFYHVWYCNVYRMQYNPALSQYFGACPHFYCCSKWNYILVNQFRDSTTLLALLCCFFGRTKSQYTSFIINVNPLFVMVIFIV